MGKDPKAILDATTPQVRKIVGEILEIEREYQHFQNIDKTGKNDEICNRIIRLIKKEEDQ